ncbi:MAG: hypothetical protein ACYS8K_08815, partial [Planctomycetota bacterium]
SYAYRVDRLPVASGQVQLVVRLLDVGRGPQAGGAPEPPRVLTKPFTTGKADYEAAQALVREAEGSATDWDAHKSHLDEAFSQEAKTAREGWRKIATDLEGAHERAPNHLGILKDLLVAYTQMNGFEGRTVRGANLCVLIPRKVAEFEALAAPLSTAEQLFLRRARALFHFQTGLYPLAVTETGNAESDPQLASLRKAMQAIGQAAFTEKEVFDVHNEVAPYRVTAYSAEGKAPSDKMLYHRWFFVTRPKAAAAARARVWYSLASQTLKDKPRFYLYGHMGHGRTLLMMYGEQEPAYEAVKAKVKEMMLAALSGPTAAPWLSGRGLVVLLVVVLLVAAVGLWILFKRRRGATLVCLIACIATVQLVAATAARNDPAQQGEQKLSDDPEAAALPALRDRIEGLVPPLHGQQEDGAPEEQKPERPPEPPEDKPAIPADFPKVPQAVEVEVPPALAGQPPAVMKLVVSPRVMKRIVKGDLHTVDVVRTQVAEAVVAGAISEAMGQQIAESAERLARGAEALRRNRQSRIDIESSITFRHLKHRTKPGMVGAAAEAAQATSPRSTKGDAAAWLASEAYESNLRRPGGVAGRGRRGTAFFQGDTLGMDAPQIAPRSPAHPVRVAPPSPVAGEPKFVPKGVKILIDEAMLAEVLREKSEQVKLEEIAALEDSLLSAANGVEAFQRLQEYTEAKKVAFLQKSRKFRNLGDVRMVSLKALVSKLKGYRDRWDQRPGELRTLGGLTRIHGFMRERTTGDLTLIGRVETGAPPILFDDFTVGLRTVWREGLTPGCSLDPDPRDPGGPQVREVVRVPEDSPFALTMLRADYAMKRIMAGAKGEHLGIPGYRTIADCAFARGFTPGRAASRFWLFPVQPSAREIQLGLGGTSALF